MRRMWATLFLFVLFFGLTLPRAFAEPDERPPLEYFYENYCDSCNPAADFQEEFKALTGESTGDYRYVTYNVAKADGKAALAEAIERYSLDEDQVRIPMAVIDGTAYMGDTQIRQDLPEYAVNRSETTDSTVYYLYVSACESCAKAKQVISGLPERTNVTMGNYSFESALRVIELDIGQETERAYALFDAYGVPEDKRLAPLVLVGERYFQGAESIGRSLAFAIGRGEGLRTPLLDEVGPLPALEFGSTALAGLIGGLNPCALSMLLLFLSMLANMKKNTGAMAGAFLFSKFVVYLLIGTVLLTAFQALNLSWLPLATKVLLTALSIFLIALNLRDAHMARKERYGEIRNQLPPGLRRGLQSRIKGALEGGKATYWLAAGLGALVAAGEFLCSGQVYLATLLTALQKGQDTRRLFMLLLCYCAAFIAPSASLCLLIVRGRGAMELSEFMRRHMPAVKLVTALLFIGVLVAVWVM